MQVDGQGARTVWLSKVGATTSPGGFIFYLNQPIFNHQVDPELPDKPLKVKVVQFQVHIDDDVDHVGCHYALVIPELNTSSTLAGVPGIPANPMAVGILQGQELVTHIGGNKYLYRVGYMESTEARDVYTQSQVQQLTVQLYHREPDDAAWNLVANNDIFDFFVELAFVQ